MMKKKAIIQLLEEKHLNLFAWLDQQPEENWTKAPENRWTTGQHILHLVNSEKALNKAMSIPGFLLKYKYGKANRTVRDYEAVAQKYEEKLAANLDRAKRFNKDLRTPSFNDKEGILNELKIQHKKLERKTYQWNDRKLDTLILPHPLMGRMPIRELLMWTAHHTEHHSKILKRDY